MAIYVPDSTRRRRAAGIAGACLIAGFAIGGVVGRATSPAVDDSVAAVRDRAADAVTALQRLPIEYEQAVAGEGGEDTSTITSALDRARATLDDAFEELDVFGPAATAPATEALDAVEQAVEAEVPAAEFEDAIAAAVATIESTFGLRGG